MILGSFGGKSFEVSSSKLNTPNDLQISGDLNTSTEDASGKKPATTIKGPGLIKISAEIILLASAGVDVRAEIDGWMAIKDAAVSYPFLLCGKAVSLNQFLLTSCSASDYAVVPINNTPTMVKATLKLEWEEYLSPGAQKSDAASAVKTKSSAPGLTEAKTPAAYKTPAAAQKAEVKRNNVQMARMMQS
ncbi:hypothetical protein CAFE_17860 [Caprobacter fermentans]|uniref:Uncharacterized protein n=1 Tax=Caproicibacter fermentans TaxID=2576756 RepID=A0A6N8HZ03_9FIRM|nr:hypothetical protein [Caproicibacter fermentans]MVB11084.1 hypothetical protein [Caproicibacter fermentans]